VQRAVTFLSQTLLFRSRAIGSALILRDTGPFFRIAQRDGNELVLDECVSLLAVWYWLDTVLQRAATFLSPTLLLDQEHPQIGTNTPQHWPIARSQ
jgi:hypothetical protein